MVDLGNHRRPPTKTTRRTPGEADVRRRAGARCDRSTRTHPTWRRWPGGGRAGPTSRSVVAP